MLANEAQLRGIFIDICRGYSRATWGKTPVYIKHFSHFEQLDTELEREKYFEIAKKKGILTNEEKLKWLINNELWSKEKDNKIRDLSAYVDGLKKSKLKAMTKMMADDYQKQIDESQNEIDILFIEKNRLIGLTAESYAEQKLQSSYIYYSFFKDDSLKVRLFTEKEFKRLDDEEVEELLTIYLEHIKKFTHENIKQISISNFFTSYFYLTDDLTKFFGKPLCDLTYNQVNLISYGSYFRRLLGQAGDSIPDEFRKSPDKIEEFCNRKANTKQNTSKNGRTAYIGATEKDDGAFLGGTKDDTLKKGEIDTLWGAQKSGKLN